MRNIGYRRHPWRRIPGFGLAVVTAVGIAVSSARASEPGDAPIVLAALYGGSDLSGGQSAWPPRGTPKSGAVQPLPLGGNEIAPIPASSPSRTPALQPPGLLAPGLQAPGLQAPGLQAAQNTRPGGQGLPDILSEIRVAILAHDVGVIERGREDGVDLGLEVYFSSPAVLETIWSPRPLVGIALNTAGDTSQVYGGLAWDWVFWQPFFIEGALALAVHDGKLDSAPSDRKALGCRVLFRESVALGARFLGRHTIAVQFAHISNAGLCSRNPGLNTFGVQYGISF
jgi:lipid A 3-O-deacylase